ncbi:MAG: hypothetical protein ACO1SV_14940 [Fimbriimonas sp.]
MTAGFIAGLIFPLLDGQEVKMRDVIYGGIIGAAFEAGIRFLQAQIQKLVKPGEKLTRFAKATTWITGGIAGGVAGYYGARVGECMAELFWMGYEAQSLEGYHI